MASIGIHCLSFFCFLSIYFVDGFTVNKFFRSHMVLQEAPKSANIFGTAEEGPISVIVSCASGLSFTSEAQVKDGKWIANLVPVSSGERCSIGISHILEDLLLEDVLFGDVWFCAGQSNLGWVLGGIDNGTEEVQASQEYTNIRFLHLDATFSDKEEDDIIAERKGWETWNTVNSIWPEGIDWEGKGHWKTPLHDISAICFLFAREMSKHLGNKPLGLVASAYAGTRIDSWASPEVLQNCSVEDYIDEKHPYNSNSYIYNSMIHPFFSMSIKGLIWYQGESSSSWHPDNYPCILDGVVNDWRKSWNQHSDTDPQFPVGVVQLGPWANPPEEKDIGSLFPLMRWHQTLDKGYLPNRIEPNMFMAVAIDTYNGKIHPKNKQLPAKRLGIAGLSVAYNLPDFPSKGPYPKNTQISIDGDKITALITYDENPISYNPSENSGFFLCCGQGNSTSGCSGDQVESEGSWKLIEMADVAQTSDDTLQVVVTCNSWASLGYLWAESPVTMIHGLPLYSVNKYGLPGNPWWTPLKQ